MPAPPITSFELIGMGYPESIQHAFLSTSEAVPGFGSEDIPVVIMSRSPGGAGTNLIEEGYDLKGFKVKAKSCNWGPMAGFICQHPLLNKSGASKKGFNLRSHKAYIAWRRANLVIPAQASDVQLEPAVLDALLAKRQKEQWTEEKYQQELTKLEQSIYADRVKFWSPAPFQHLRISENRRKEVLGEARPGGGEWPFQPVAASFHLQQLGDTMWAGVARSSDSSVCMDFLLIKEVVGELTLWKVYYREIFELSGETYVKVELGPGFDPDLGAPVPQTVQFDNLAQIYNGLWGQLQLPKPAPQRTAIPANGSTDFNELHAAVNPYMAYPAPDQPDQPDQRYLNSISGDYDLFATWPRKTPSDAPEIEPTLSLLTRVSELSYIKTKLEQQSELFGRLGEQLFRVHPLAAPNVIIDVPPGFDEIDAYEDHELGNIHELGHTVAQVFNARLPVSANRAFHTEECGRPQVDEIEFPVGVFLPPEAVTAAKAGRVPLPASLAGEANASKLDRRAFGFEQGDYDVFMWMVCVLSVDHYVTLNKGWLCELCELAMTADERAAYKQAMTPAQTDAARSWIAARDRFHNVPANQAKREYVRARLWDIFIGPASEVQATKARQDRAFSTVLRRFVEFAYMDPATPVETQIRGLLAAIDHPAPQPAGDP